VIDFNFNVYGWLFTVTVQDKSYNSTLIKNSSKEPFYCT